MTRELLVVVGARPNIVKVAPLLHAAEAQGAFKPRVLHTGQHYDAALSGDFMDQLEFPEPAHWLGVGSGSHAEQTAGVLVGVERVLRERPADAVLVAGDVNSTVGAALAATKVQVPVIHLEAGLRSGDWSMPEEVNRVVTDRISDLLLCPSQDAVENLEREGVPPQRIALVGNTMIDSLLRMLEAARALGRREKLGLDEGGYALVTLHRPAVVDDAEHLRQTLHVLGELGQRLPVLFPVHPRTQRRMEDAGLEPPRGVTLLDPLGYLDFIALMADARLVVTDSGGVQEETAVLGVACLTYRTTTERPITIEYGKNRLIGTDPGMLLAACLQELRNASPDAPSPIPLWDGAAGPRAARVIGDYLARLGEQHVSAAAS